MKPSDLALPDPQYRSQWAKVLLFLLVTAIGLYYLKWSPYYLKSSITADTHSIDAAPGFRGALAGGGGCTDNSRWLPCRADRLALPLISV